MQGIKNLNLKPKDEAAYTAARIEHWNQDVSSNKNSKIVAGKRFYQRRISEIYRFLIPQGARVLDLGCGDGHLLASLNPSYGVGIDFSSGNIAEATEKYPLLKFITSDLQDSFPLEEFFDYVICTDVVNELWDVQTVLSNLSSVCTSNTRLLLNFRNKLWKTPRKIATEIGIARPQMVQNWLAKEDISNLLYLADFEVIRISNEILVPFDIPLLANFSNRVLVKLWPFRFFGMTNLVIARPVPRGPKPQPIVSVIVPARDESGNIKAIFDRIPEMGRGTEIIFVEGGSSDDTYSTIEKEIALRQRPLIKLIRQTGSGKADAVRLGFANASGELLMILDADLTVAPEDLPRFYQAWLDGKGDFINGIRMIYPMEERAMRFLNMLGNKAFSVAFSFLLGQKVKDTACGTKVLSKYHYDPILKNRSYFGDFDRFGDWDLLFGAAKFHLKITDLPIRYRDRVYGETKMQRWRIGVLLVRMVMLGLRRLKFV